MQENHFIDILIYFIKNLPGGDNYDRFCKIGKGQYAGLLKQKEAIESELKPLEKYLEAVGILTKKKRGPRKKKAQ